MTDPVRVVLVDDHVLFRTGLEVVLGADPRVEVVGQAADGVAAVEVARAARPDIVILDLRLPGCSGLECCRRIRDELPDTQVLVLTASDAEDDLVAALRAGAGGYLVKDGDPAELVEAVLGLREGRSIVPPDLAARLKNMPTWEAAAIKAEFHAYAEERGLKLGKVMPPVRAAVAGTMESPDLPDLLQALGQPRVVARVERATRG